MGGASALLPRLPIFEAIAKHDPRSTAVIHSLSGRSFSYGEILGDVFRLKNRLLDATGKSKLDGQRIAFLVENSYDYVGKPKQEPLLSLFFFLLLSVLP